MSWAKCIRRAKVDMSREEYQTHCQAIGRIIAAGVRNENGGFDMTQTSRAIDFYKEEVGLKKE